jgi:hypothetical protein
MDDATQLTDNEKRIESLLAVIGEECDRRLARDGEVRSDEVTKWLIREERKELLKGISGLIGVAMDRSNDAYQARQIIARHPDLAEPQVAQAIQQVARTLGVGYWYLCKLDAQGEKQKLRKCFDAAVLIHRLRAEEADAQADAMSTLEELVEPVTKDHPDMTLGEAMDEMKRRTEETIRGLEKSADEPPN